MKVAIVYNRDSRSVINLFGVPNREKIGLITIKKISDALKEGGHTVRTFEGDKDLVDRLEEFMPRVLKGERPGMAFNVSYGIQGQARYTHVPAILEMVGIPYVGSGPLAHSLALDKVVSKMIFRQNGLPTPDFAVLGEPGFETPDLAYPLIVKPKNEAVSFGIRVVNDENELREAAQVIFDTFSQPVLAEQYIEGGEINVGILGNAPPEALPPVRIVFGEGGPNIYTYEDKTRKSEREIRFEAPAKLPKEVIERAGDIARKAFTVLGCFDCSRVDMRMDSDNNLYLLEINSLPSLGEHGSYVVGAELVGLDFNALVNRLVEVASARYFGTPHPPELAGSPADPQEVAFQFLTKRRDQMERDIQEWVAVSSRTDDPVGVRAAATEMGGRFNDMAMRPVEDLTDGRSVWTWETRKGMNTGTLLVAHLDVPLKSGASAQVFHKESEWLYGEGVGCSRAPLVMMEHALRSLRYQRKLRTQNLGVLLYGDEGRDCEFSENLIRKAAARASRVLVLRPGSADKVVTRRRGLRKYDFEAIGPARRLGHRGRKRELAQEAFKAMDSMIALTSHKQRVAVSTVDLASEAYPLMNPHLIRAKVLLSYPDEETANSTEASMRAVLDDGRFRWELEQISDRPPMTERRAVSGLAKTMGKVAEKWEIPFGTESSVWPSVAGLVDSSVGVLCGIGAVAKDLYTSSEAVSRISLMGRTLLLAEFLARDLT